MKISESFNNLVQDIAHGKGKFQNYQNNSDFTVGSKFLSLRMIKFAMLKLLWYQVNQQLNNLFLGDTHDYKWFSQLLHISRIQWNSSNN